MRALYQTIHKQPQDGMNIMTSSNKNTDHMRHPDKDERAYGERNEDPYQSRGKYQEPQTALKIAEEY